MDMTARVVHRFVEGQTKTALSSVKTPLYGHDSEATAYVVDDYPYGFKLRTKIRYWLESAPKKGWRFVSQTMNPKNGRWNAPKKSTYTEFGGAMYLDSQDHVQWVGIGQYSNDAAIEDFVKTFPKADLSVVKMAAKAKIKYLTAIIEGKARWTVNGVPQEPSEAEIGEKRHQLEFWTDLEKKL
jgi:hypothetical protein